MIDSCIGLLIFLQLVAIDEGFRADLKRTRTYSPTCKRKIKEHMAQIEDHFREGHLMWLQQVEQVRDQFQELADQIQHKEYSPFSLNQIRVACIRRGTNLVLLMIHHIYNKDCSHDIANQAHCLDNRAYNKFYKMRAELQVTKQMWKHEKEEEHNALREAQEKAIHVVRRRKLKVLPSSPSNRVPKMIL